MIALWLLYAAVFGVLVAAVAAGLDRVAALWRLPRRGIWVAAIAVSLVTPLGILLQPATPPPAAVSGDFVTAGVPTTHASAEPVAEQLAERVVRLATVTAHRLAPLDRPLLLGWGLVSLLVLGVLARSALRLRARRTQWERRTVDGTDVLIAPDLGPAALAGPPPGIVLPHWALDMDAPLRRLVLRHELEHRQAGDPWLLLGGVVALALAPWNVALWWQVGRLRLAVEVDCDARVLRASGDAPANVERYGLLLLALGQRGGGLLRLPVPALSEPVSSLERRIAAMTDRTPRNRWLRATALAAVAATVTALACVTPTPNRVLGPDGNLPTTQVASTPTSTDSDLPYFEFQVEDPVSPLNNVRPTYPSELAVQGVAGRVIAQFVVDTDGTADVSTFKVLESDHQLLSDAVLAALPQMRFTAAAIGGRKVKQVVQQPFVFGIARKAAPTGQAADTVMRFDRQTSSSQTAPARSGEPYSGVAQKAAPPNTIAPPPVTADPNQTYFEFQVEKPVGPLNNSGPVYPAELRAAGVKGRVIAQFVVGTDGKADVRTFKVLESDHELFSAAVREALPNMRFTSAEIGGRRVKQLVQQPFVFDMK